MNSQLIENTWISKSENSNNFFIAKSRTHVDFYKSANPNIFFDCKSHMHPMGLETTTRPSV